ncbi:MAG TPA: O-antigen ligase family protein [Candidatus Portnoybacteria bacterium]|nr:O-antigen ligase family protein [Candidatus Portnoybacteria bacterium]
MNKLLKIEKALFYFLALAFFWQIRLVWPGASQQFNEWGSFFVYATDIIIVAILILWLARSGKKLSAQNIFNGTNIALAVFLFFCALSILAGQDKSVAFFRSAKLLEMAGLYFYIRYNFSALYNFKRFWQWFLLGAALQSVVAIAQFLTQKSLGLKIFAESPLAASIDGVAKIVVGGEKIVRAYGLVPHPNILAAILVAAIFGLAWLFLEQKKTRLKTVLFSAAFLLLGAALFFTFSRSVIIIGGGLFLIWLVSFWWKNKEYRQPIIFICIFLFVISCSLLILYWPYVASRYGIAALPGSQSIDLRAFYNQQALKMAWQKPILGVGQGNFTMALRDNISLPDWQYQPAHNIYLLAAAENGLGALLAFLVFLFLTVRSVWSSKKELLASCLLVVISCLLLISCFDHFLWDLQQGQILFWLMIGLLASTSLRSSAD